MTSQPALSKLNDVVTEDLLIASDTAGIQIHVRNKRLASVKTFSAERTVVLMHGATFSSGSLFDVRVAGFSFLDYLAACGYDVYAVDARGYGMSTRPPEMNDSPQSNPPVGRTESAVSDLGRAIDAILKRRDISSLNLVAMSWGASIAGVYTSRNNAKIAKLVLLVPLWVSATPLPLDFGGDLGAYRKVRVLDVKERWLSAAPEDKRDGLIPAGWFEQWAEATLAEDAQGAAETPPTMRAVNGPVIDVREFWNAGRPLYEPKDITKPVLLIHAEWDFDTPFDVARSLFFSLTSTPYKRWVEIGEATHMVVLEKNRLQVFDAIQGFLAETFAPAQ